MHFVRGCGNRGTGGGDGFSVSETYIIIIT